MCSARREASVPWDQVPALGTLKPTLWMNVLGVIIIVKSH